MSLFISLRNTRVLSISFLLVAHYLYKDSRYYAKIQKMTLDQAINSALEAPETSLPEHHVPLPMDPPDSVASNYNDIKSNANANVNASNFNSSIWFDAVDTYGNRGYVADPKLFRRLVLQWQEENPNATYWDRVKHFQSHLQLDIDKTNNLLNMDEICSMAESNNKGGNELKDDGVKMLMNVKVDKTPTPRKGCMEGPINLMQNDNDQPKLFCGIYTHNAARDFTRLTALSYGWKCDGFIAFSTVTIPSLGMVGLLHRGPENYRNMIQKVRSIWGYIATHYLDQYDYFHIGGDDTHLIVENFRSLLLEHETENYDTDTMGKEEEGRILGQLKPNGKFQFVRGGAGYTLNRAALRKLLVHMPKCAPDVQGYWEDNIISKCAFHLGLTFSDNRDSCTGQQRSHSENPGVLFNANGVSDSEQDKNMRSWASLPHPIVTTQRTGMHLGMDAVSNHSVTFHRLRYPQWMARHHALLYHACPSNTALGRLINETYDSLTFGGA